MIEPVYIKTQKRIQRTGTYIDHGVTVGIQLIIDEKGEQQVLDMELIKVGNLSLFAPPGSYSFSHSRGSQHCSAEGMNTHSFPSCSGTRLLGSTGGGAGP